jgi:D-alanyl-D-alanine carboxypeptidase/D-alanyl-D-alanine-endopeptidase (penicillin-binding protein 4)
MKKIIIIIVLWQVLFSQGSFKKIDSLLNIDFFNYTNIGICVYDLDNNKTLYQKNSKLLFRPASNQKIITSATALDYLGPNYNFETKIFSNGNINNDGILQGDLIIQPGFDPILNINDIDNLISQLVNKKIKKINGDLILDLSNIDTLEWNRDWTWDDEPNDYAAHISSIALEENCVNVKVVPSLIGKNPYIILYPDYQNLNVINNAITVDSSGKSDLIITRDWYYRNNTIIIKGKISLKDKITETVNLENPYKSILIYFYRKLLANGIILNGEINVSRENKTFKNKELLANISHNIKDVLKKFNKESYNLAGEMILRLLGYKMFDTTGSSEFGVKVVKNYIKKLNLNPDNYQIIDGSGLAPTNYINNELIIEILKDIYKNKQKFKIFYNSLPIAGVDGTLSRRMKNTDAMNNVRAKTGTINGVSSLSGYVKNKKGNMLAFSIFTQNHVNNPTMCKKIQDEICIILSQINE